MTYRREIGDYDHQDLIDFIKALQTVKESGKYNELADLHFESKRMAHNRPAFFPWHRYYIRLLEMMLQQVNPKVCFNYCLRGEALNIVAKADMQFIRFQMADVMPPVQILFLRLYQILL